jgi:hypothetical protein
VLVFLTEEPSMATLLDGLLPRLFPGLAFRCVPHEGKNDLKRSIPRKLRAWEHDARFIVLIDNDGGDCLARKQEIARLCAEAGRPDTLVRIVCQELEAWYLGDFPAVAEAFKAPKLATFGGKAKYRNPDALNKPSVDLARLVPAFQKISGARAIADHLRRDANASASFQALVSGVERLVATAV